MITIYKIPALLLIIVLIIKSNVFAQTDIQKNDNYLTIFSASEIRNENLLNSPASDFSPVIYGDKIIFISDRKNNDSGNKNNKAASNFPNCKLYSGKTDRVTGRIQASLTMKELEFGYHTGPLVFSKDNEVIYFTKTRLVKRKQNVTSDPTSWVRKTTSEFVNHLEIYSAKRKDDKWEDIEAFVYNNSREYSVGHPALSPDGNTIYFVSDMPGGLGETDIYFCKKRNDGTWSVPVNAGKEINTPGKESFPVISKDGTLYFSSDGHPGHGGLDMFMAHGSENNWADVLNLGKPLNSTEDDFGIIFDSTGNSGYFSSNRDGGAGLDDIYSFKLKSNSQSSCLLSGTALADKDQPISGALLQFFKEGQATPEIVYTDKEGHFSFNLEQGIKYVVKGVKGESIASVEAIIAVCKSSSGPINLTLHFKQPVKEIQEFEKAAFTMINIYYDLDKADIKPNAVKELNKIVKLMEDDPQINIELNAHADSRASDEYNMELSGRRAEAAINYLVSKGIDRSRITANSHGKSQVVNHCIDGIYCPEKYHLQNRRTELKIIQNYVEVQNDNK